MKHYKKLLLISALSISLANADTNNNTYVYVNNVGDNTISSYMVSQSNGALTPIGSAKLTGYNPQGFGNH